MQYFLKIKNIQVQVWWSHTYSWLDGLGVWFALRVREVPGSNPGQAQLLHEKWLLNQKFVTRGLAIFSKIINDGIDLNVRFRDLYALPSSEIEPWSVYILFYQLKHSQKASIAQWQSTGLVNQGSRVQSSLEAVWLILFLWRLMFFLSFFSFLNLYVTCVLSSRIRSASLFSSVVEHWSRKPGVVSSILTGGKGKRR